MSTCFEQELLDLIISKKEVLTTSDIQYFLDQDGFDINKEIRNTVHNIGDIPIFIISEAIIACNFEVIELLMQYKPKLNLFKNEESYNPINVAVLRDCTNVLSLLVEDKDLDFDVRFTSLSPIEYASYYCSPEFLEIMLEHYKETEAAKIDCHSALLSSIQRNKYSIAKTLLESGKIDVNYTVNGCSALEMTLHSPLLSDEVSATYIKLLVEHGADIHKENSNPFSKFRTLLDTVLSLEGKQYDILIEAFLSGYLSDVQDKLQKKIDEESQVNAIKVSSLKREMAKRPRIGGLKI